MFTPKNMTHDVCTASQLHDWQDEIVPSEEVQPHHCSNTTVCRNVAKYDQIHIAVNMMPKHGLAGRYQMALDVS